MDLSIPSATIFSEGAILQIDNYLVLKGYGWPGFNKMRLFKQDKGQVACAKAFIDSILNGEECPIPYNEVMESSKIAIEASNMLRS